MKSLELTLSLLDEVGRVLGIDTTNDRKTVVKRCGKEGEGFLTLALPAFEKDLLVALDRGYAGSDLFKGFRLRGGLPVFLRGFLLLLFPRQHGGTRRVTEDTQLAARILRGLRQVLAAHGKISRECSPRRVRAAKKAYVLSDRSLTYSLSPVVKELFRELYGEALFEAESRLFKGQDVFFRHGPGAVSERLSANQKWAFEYWTEALQCVLPWWSVIRTTGEVVDAYRVNGDVEPTILKTKPVSRLVSVPKTAKAPRLIAIEPTAHQFVQQGLLSLLDELVPAHPIWDVINWHDQERNRALAQRGSVTKELATLDLSEASDSVHWGLVCELLDRNRFFLKHVAACRTERIDIDGVQHDLVKFASMGSALTFPIESMVFATVALAGVYGNCADALKAVRSRTAQVSVYGDDIVVPVDKVPDVVALLASHGFRVNGTKSFWTGSFRESCGADYFDGRPTQPVRVRKSLDDPDDSEWLEKTIELRNRLFEAGYWDSVALLDRWLGDNIPYLPVGTPALGLYTYEDEKIRWRTNSRLQRREARCLRILRELPDDILSGWEALRKVLNPRRGDKPLQDEHLRIAGRPRTGKAKFGWTAAP